MILLPEMLRREWICLHNARFTCEVCKWTRGFLLMYHNQRSHFALLQSQGLLCKAEPRLRAALDSAKPGLKPEAWNCCGSSQPRDGEDAGLSPGLSLGSCCSSSGQTQQGL